MSDVFSESAVIVRYDKNDTVSRCSFLPEDRVHVSLVGIFMISSLIVNCSLVTMTIVSARKASRTSLAGSSGQVVIIDPSPSIGSVTTNPEICINVIDDQDEEGQDRVPAIDFNKYYWPLTESAQKQYGQTNLLPPSPRKFSVTFDQIDQVGKIRTSISSGRSLGHSKESTSSISSYRKHSEHNLYVQDHYQLTRSPSQEQVNAIQELVFNIDSKPLSPKERKQSFDRLLFLGRLDAGLVNSRKSIPGDAENRILKRSSTTLDFTLESQKSPKKLKWKDTMKGLPKQISFDVKEIDDFESPLGPDAQKHINSKSTTRLYKTLAARNNHRDNVHFDVYNSARRLAIKIPGTETTQETLCDNK